MGMNLNDNKNHVEFYAFETHFSVVVYNENYSLEKEKGKEITNKIIEQISQNGIITIIELSRTLLTTEETIIYYMNKLRENGIIERKGSTKSGVWIVIERKK